MIEGDRKLMLAMSKCLVAMANDTNKTKWAGELALEQYKFRQQFFPETLDEENYRDREGDPRRGAV